MSGQQMRFVQLEAGGESVLRWVEPVEKQRVRVICAPYADELTIINITAARSRDIVPYWRVE
jgi:hypothetical protein